VRALAIKSLRVEATSFFQYRVDFTETACVCALMLIIGKDWRKKRHWVHPVVSQSHLIGKVYKMYKDL
jgi:hypothetical protein